MIVRISLLISVFFTLLFIAAPLAFASHVHMPSAGNNGATSASGNTSPSSGGATHANGIGAGPSGGVSKATENCCAVTAKSPPSQPLPKVSVCNAPAGYYDCLGHKIPVTPTPTPTPQPTPSPSSDNNGCPAGYYRPFPGLGNYYACQKNPITTVSKCFLPSVEDKNGRCSIPPNTPSQPNAVYDLTNGRCMNCSPGIGPNNTLPVNPHIGIVGGIIK